MLVVIFKKFMHCSLNLVYRMSFVLSKDSSVNMYMNRGVLVIYEPHREKTGFLPMRKQRRRSASR